MDVSIIIVSWRVRHALEKCLNSIFQNTKDLTFEVFVVDNDSQDETVKMVMNNSKEVNLIANKENNGFAKACNQAIKEVKGDYILLLNPDTEIADNAIAKTRQFMQQTNDCGIAGCRINNEDGTLQPSVRKFPDFVSHIFILLKLHNFFPNQKSVRKYYQSDFQHQETKPVDQVMGAFFMIKRKVLDKIGLLDEHFFIWYEEVDFCKRALKAGWKTYFYADTHIIHQKGESFAQKAPLDKQLILNRSLLYYFYKHRSRLEYFILICLYPVSLILALLVQLFRIKKKRKEL